MPATCSLSPNIAVTWLDAPIEVHNIAHGDQKHEKLAVHYERMESNLGDSGGEWYLGQRSFADTFLYVLTRWIEKTPLSIDSYPALKAHRARMEADEGVKRALARQAMEPIG